MGIAVFLAVVTFVIVGLVVLFIAGAMLPPAVDKADAR